MAGMIFFVCPVEQHFISCFRLSRVKATEYEQPVLVNCGSRGAWSLFAPAGWKAGLTLKQTPGQSAGTEEWNQAWRLDESKMESHAR